MKVGSEQKIGDIWRQEKTPVIFRKGKGNRLMVRFPFAKDNRLWLKGDKRISPKWINQFNCWEVPYAWFDDLITKILSKYKQLYVIQPYRKQEKCAPACWNAKGHECNCSCMGENHGSQGPNGNWLVVSETFATRWHGRELACRLMTSKD